LFLFSNEKSILAAFVGAFSWLIRQFRIAKSERRPAATMPETGQKWVTDFIFLTVGFVELRFFSREIVFANDGRNCFAEVFPPSDATGP
jgi:hypothetical protein